MKKRIFTVFLSAIFAASLAACGSETGTTSESASVSSSSSSESASVSEASSASGDTASSDNDYTVFMVVKHTDEHFTRVMSGAQAKADELGITLDIVSPTSATAYDEQQNAIETALTNEKYDAYIIAPLQSDTVANLVKNCDKPVIAIDTDFDSDKKTSFVGTGNESAAYEGGKAAVEAAKEAGFEDLTAVIITGVQGDETHEARLAGYRAGVEEAGGEVIEVQYTETAADKAVVAMDGIMNSHPEGVAMILCTYDDACLAAARAASTVEAYQNTIFCGFDGNQEAADSVADGTISMTVAQMGYDMGYLAVEAAVDALNGEEVESYIDSGNQVITPDNVEEYIEFLKSVGSYD